VFTQNLRHYLTIDQIVNYEGELPVEVSLENKSEMEQLKLINQLEEDDKQTILKIINTMLTKKKFKDFFNKNITAL
jgi:23S rRNA maturation-related 3'-5' exoribonuclease YhaM